MEKKPHLNPKELRQIQSDFISGKITKRVKISDGREAGLIAIIGKKDISFHARLGANEMIKIGTLGEGEQRNYIAGLVDVVREMKHARKQSKGTSVRQGHTPAAKLTLEQYLDRHYYMQTAVDGGISSYDDPNCIRLRKQFSMFMNKRMCDFTKGDMETWKNVHSDQTTQFTTRKRHYRTLSAVFGFAVKKDHLPRNPIAGVYFPNDEKEKYKALTREELQKVLDVALECNTRDFLFILICMMTGARPSEVLNIRIEDINFEEEKIILHKAYVNPQTKKRQITKSNKTRYLSVDEYILNIIRRYLEEQGDIITDYLFIDPVTKKPLKKFKSQFEKIRPKFGFDCTLYDLRHSFATILAQLKLSTSEVMVYLGQSNETTTEKYLKKLTKVDNAPIVAFRKYITGELPSDKKQSE